MRIKGGGYIENSDGLLRSEDSDVPPLHCHAHFKALPAGVSFGCTGFLCVRRLSALQGKKGQHKYEN